ncbi:SDR family oxidoreductase [Dyadobacter crusticola]|uniref:SDR family oxidoreductase n=1 Tax=Dyadobacter crusticola TaxID=292407 RepID=UPI0004E110A5|nr:SDR family oxidoreductase [Dyadobacter crusticola]
MNLDLNGKTAIVCGATQGIGLASAVELALLGANVTLVARNEEKLRSAVDTLDTSAGQLHRYVVADFSETENLKEAFENYLRLCPDVHILINNTGGPSGGAIIEADSDQFLKTFQMHLINNQFLVQSVLPSMKKEGFGRIVNIISTSVKQPIAGLGVSNTIRGAVASWAKTLSLEIAQFGITVNNVLPGYTETARLYSVLEMRAQSQNKTAKEVGRELAASIPIRRFTKPEETAAAVAFLCSPAAASINGVNLPVDGGRTESL